MKHIILWSLCLFCTTHWVHAQEIKVDSIAKHINLDSVTVYSAYKADAQGNRFDYTPMESSSSISIIGEPDVIRHISSLPGVSQGIEGSLGLFVRGGNTGSNSILFNQVPMYSYSHVIGLFSAFAPDIIDETSFYEGGSSAASGNFSSSLIEIKTKQPFGTPAKVKITLSPYITGGYLSLPLKKNKISLQLSARTSLIPLFTNLLMRGEIRSQLEVFDFTSILNWKLNSKNNMDLMFYTSNDYFDFKSNSNQITQNWGTTVAKIRWNSSLTSKIHWSTWMYYDQANTSQKQISFDDLSTTTITSQLLLGSSINESSINTKLSYQITNQLIAQAGINYQAQTFNPSTERSIASQKQDNDFSPTFTSNLFSLFGELKYSQEKRFDASIGYRHTTQSEGENNFDLHALTHIYVTSNFGVQLTYDRLSQYYHVLEGLPVGWSLNIRIPVSKAFPTETTNQYYGGVYWNHQYQNLKLNMTWGIYHRQMDNLVSYKNSVNLFGINDVNWEDEITSGKGESYGMEISSALKGPRFGITFAYTLSKTNRLYPFINGGKIYPFKFDRTHILNLQGKYTTLKGIDKKGHRWEQYVNGVISYSSGNRVTLPVASYEGVMPPYWDQREQGNLFPYAVDDNAYNREQMSDKNAIKMKDYFRLDVAYTFVKYRPKNTQELSLSIFNVLNRHNPYLYYNKQGEWNQLSIAPIMPCVRWSIAF